MNATDKKDDAPATSPKTVEQAIEERRGDARALAGATSAAVLQACLGKEVVDKFFTSGTVLTHLDNVKAGAGRPTDPIANFMVEQLAWAHHRLGLLHCQAAGATTPELAKEYNAAAARLMTEFRKTALALREYRMPMPPKQVTVVQQQNLAAGDQQVAFIEGSARPEALLEKSADSKLTSKPVEAIAHAPNIPLIPESKNGSSRAKEPTAPRAIDAGRAATAARVNAAAPTLEVFDGAENGGG
jgi:hypothetical protein